MTPFCIGLSAFNPGLLFLVMLLFVIGVVTSFDVAVFAVAVAVSVAVVLCRRRYRCRCRRRCRCRCRRCCFCRCCYCRVVAIFSCHLSVLTLAL